MSSFDDHKMLTGAASGAASGAIAGSAVPGIGTAIGAGVGLLGGVLSNMSSERQTDRGYSFQERAAKEGIQWKVEDAKRAGIHPLYAMGAPSFSMQPIVTQDNIGPSIREMGQSIQDASRNTLSEQQKAMQFMEYQVAASQVKRNDAEAELFRTQAAKNLQGNGSNINPPGLGIHNEMGQNPTGGGQGFYEVKPAESISQKIGMPESSAGENPTLQLRRLPGGLPMFMDIAEGDSPEETWKEKSIPATIGLIMHNQRIFGGNWAEDFIRSKYLGLRVRGKYEKYNLDNPDWLEKWQGTPGHKGIWQGKKDWLQSLPYKALPPGARKKYMSSEDMRKRYNFK